MASSSSALYFKFDLAQSCLHFVNEKNIMVLEKLVKMNKIVLIGIDTESKPNHRPGVFNPVSIIQMAFRSESGYEHVVIVDLIALSKVPKAMKLFDDLMTPLFASTTVYKLGQGLVGDFKVLIRSYPAVKAFSLCNAIFDTNVFMKKLYPLPKRDYSLKHITNHFLHFDLDKSQQMSDWARRPLSVKQMHYAACDALVLLRLYDVMTYFHAQHMQRGADGNNSSSDIEDEYLDSMSSSSSENGGEGVVAKFSFKSALVHYNTTNPSTNNKTPVVSIKSTAVVNTAALRGTIIPTTTDAPVNQKRKFVDIDDEALLSELSKSSTTTSSSSNISSSAILSKLDKECMLDVEVSAICANTKQDVTTSPSPRSKVDEVGDVADNVTDCESILSSTNTPSSCDSPTPSTRSSSCKSVSADAYVDLYRPLKRRSWSPAHRQHQVSL